MRALITGSFGFVGRHFMRRLLNDKYDVTGVDIAAPAFGYCEQRADIREFVKYRSVDDFDLIIHCAAIVGGRLKIDGDPLAVATNLSIDADFFNWVARGKRKKRIVYFSSSAVYPVELQSKRTHCALSEGLVDLDASRFGLPDRTYGFAKFAGELMAQEAVKNYGAEVVIYRPFSGYGPDQSLDYPFPSIMRRVARRENPITIWGSGDQVRDFIHIDDIVDAVMDTYDKLDPGTTLNLGVGFGWTFKKLAQLACYRAGYVADIVTDATKPEGVFNRVADVYQMHRWYVPKISLSDGIDQVFKHFENVDKGTGLAVV